MKTMSFRLLKLIPLCWPSQSPEAAQKARELLEIKVVDYSSLPWVVFTDPQIAGAGMDEIEAEKQGISFEVSKLDLTHVPRALAAQDTRGFIKLIRNTKTDKLIGARVVAPDAFWHRCY